MKTLAMWFLLLVGLLLLRFHRRMTEFQMEIYRRQLPFGDPDTLRRFYDTTMILVGFIFVAAALRYFFRRVAVTRSVST